MRQVLRFLLSQTGKDTSILLFGNILSNAFNFLILILLTKVLQLDELGLFLTAIAFTQLIVDLVELGINPTVINMISKENENKNEIISSSFYIKIVVSLVVAGMCYLGANYISLFLGNIKIAEFIRISSIGILLMILLNWIQAILQSERRFFLAAIINTFPNFLRVIAISFFVLILNKTKGVDYYFIFNLVLVLAVLLGLSSIKLISKKINFKCLIKIFKFGFPIGLGFGIAALYTRLDQIIVFNILGSEEAGVYGLAYRLTLFYIVAIASFSLALAPRFVSLDSKDFLKYFKSSFISVCVLASLILIVSLLAPFWWNYIFESKNIPSLIPFQVLSIGVMFFVLSSVFQNAILYRFKNNFFGLYLSLASCLMIFILLIFLVPTYRSVGAAFSVSIIYFMQLLMSVVIFYYYIRRY